MSSTSKITGTYFNDAEWDSEFEALAFTAEALLAHPDPDDAELGRLSRRAISVLADWEEIDMAGRGARRAALHSAARLRAADIALDQAINDFARDLMVHVKDDRRGDEYKKFFPESHEDVIELGVDAELPSATLILMAIDADETLPQILRQHHHALRIAVQLATSSLAERAESLAQLGRHHARVEAWKESAQAMQRNLFRGIKQIAETRKHSPRWVKAFFLAPPPAS